MAAGVTPVEPKKLALLHPPGWDEATPDLHTAFARVEKALGNRIVQAKLPPVFDEAADQRALVNFAEMAHHYRRYVEVGAEQLGPETQKALQDGAATSATDYLAALDTQAAMKDGFA